MSMHVQLQVIGAKIADSGRPSKPPSPFARVGFNAVNKFKTKASKKQWAPVWDETFTLGQAPGIEAQIHLEVCDHHWRLGHQFLGVKVLGVAQVKLSTVLRATNLDDAEIITINLAKTLDASRQHSKGISPPSHPTDGQITFRVWSADLADAARSTLPSAQKQSNPRAPEEAKTPDAAQLYTAPEKPEKHKDIEESLRTIVRKLDVFIQMVDAAAQIHPYVNLAWQVTSAALKLVRNQFARDQRLAELLVAMETLYTFVDDVQSVPKKLDSFQNTIKSILIQTVECVMFVREYAGLGFCKRVFTGIWADNQMMHFMKTFNMLKHSFDSGLATQTALVSFRIDENVDKIAREQNLAKLAPSEMDDPMRPECLPNTRTEMINTITEWATSPDTECKIFWLHGFAGVGKSTISTTVANMFRELGRLGAFIFFNRDVSSRNDPAAVIRTLAYQLGEFDPRIGSAIAKVVESTPSIRQSPLRWQFQKLILEPLSTIETLSREGPVLIVFDAVDECGSSQSRKDLLDVLANETSKLPPTFRVLITSRAEHDIHEALADSPDVHSDKLDLTSHSNSEDVLAYIRFRMISIRHSNKSLSLPPEWPGDRIELLAERASGLFIWASTACQLIESSQDPEKRLADLVSPRGHTTAEEALEEVYTTALKAAGRWEDELFASDFQEILGIMLTSNFPLRTGTIDALNAADPSHGGDTPKRPCFHTIQRLGCVVQWNRDAPDEDPIRVMHPSFADFLTHRERREHDAWFIDVQAHHVRMAQLCLRRMLEELRENYCELVVTMNMSDEMRDELCRRVPEDIAYACQQWIGHVVSATEIEDVDGVVNLVGELLRVHLLHWIEAMSVVRKARQTVGLLVSLQEWMQGIKDTSTPVNSSDLKLFELVDELIKLVSDGIRFCQAFMDLIEEHPLHVYTSALPFTPTKTLLYHLYHKADSYPSVAGGFREQWSPLLTEIGQDNGSLCVVQFSPDMNQLLTVTRSALHVWDATSGARLSEMRNPDESAVTPESQSSPAAFTHAVWAPDGVHAASAAYNGCVRLWDALAGLQIGEAITAHDLAVYGLAFSPDGTRLVTASKDRRIGIFDAHNGAPIREPIDAHEDAVLCVSYFPDGSAFVSGSRDKTLCVWDALTFEIRARLVGHTGAITCITVTPDSIRPKVISGAKDRTMRVWDATSGTALFEPLHGHTRPVEGLTLAPDGLWMASASKDSTVRVWSVITGKEYKPLIRRFGRPVSSVSWGASGSVYAIAAGSTRDGRVRMWDTASVGSTYPAEKHENRVSLIAFSPPDAEGGLKLASWGWDGTVRVWDANTMEPLLSEPLEVKGQLKALNFSFDGKQIIGEVQSGGKVTVVVWNAESGERLVDTTRSADVARHIFRPPASLSVKGRHVYVAEDGSESDGAKSMIAKLPNMESIEVVQSFGRRLALGLANGSIVVVHFTQMSEE